MKNLRVVRDNWSKNHRHQGGLGAVLRCWRGQRSLESRGASELTESGSPPEVLTFSVVPWLTALWGRCLRNALAGHAHRLLVGDASGGFLGGWPELLPGSPPEVFSCLNHHHGEKLDLFFEKVCRADLVLVCDDDIFWCHGRPLGWALERFAEDRELAVVSLAPRTLISSVLKGRVAEPMGSSCLLIRRSIWRREGLSFQMAPAPEPETADWFYDTCDLAHLELLRKGYRVLVAPEEIRSHLVPLEAISAWILKAQKHPPQRLARIADLPVRRTKALRALITARRLAEIAAGLSSPGKQAFRRVPDRLDLAVKEVAGRAEPGEREAIEKDIDKALERIEKRLSESPAAAPTPSPAEAIPAGDGVAAS